MLGQRRSLRNIINYILVVMGLFALLLVWFTISRYQEIVFSEQQNATAKLAAHVVDDQLVTHAKYLIDLGMTMQTGAKFRAAFRTRDKKALRPLIADQFHQYFTTTGLVDLQRLTVYDADFNFVARASNGALQTYQSTLCPELIVLAEARTGTARNKPLTALCQEQGLPYHIAIVPIGGLTVKGYTAVIANPANTLAKIHNLPGMPYRISLPAGKTLYKSANWPEVENLRRSVTASHTIYSHNDTPLLTLTVASDITRMSQRLSMLMLQIFILAILVTVVFVYLTRRTFQKRIVLPLMRLNRHMASVQRNQEELGKGIELSGCEELDELSKEFNSMAKKLLDAQRELHEKAHTDALTGLPNREALYSRLENLEHLSKRTEKRFTLLMIDLNKFKEVNDTIGHHAGDELLKQVAERLRQSLRASDTVVRLGGDEFAVLLPTTECSEDAFEVCKKLLEQFAQPFMLDDDEVTIGASIGIAIYPDTAENSDYLMRCADKAMYEAKRSHSGYAICTLQCSEQDDCHKSCSTE